MCDQITQWDYVSLFSYFLWRVSDDISGFFCSQSIVEPANTPAMLTSMQSKQGYHWPRQKDLYPQKILIFKKKPANTQTQVINALTALSLLQDDV